MKMKKCILWEGTVSQNGYGRIPRGRPSRLVHRALWIEANGPIPPRHQIHHRCGVKLCINLDHMEVISIEDHARLHHPGPWKTHCKRGHERTPENLTSNRTCKKCHNIYVANWKRKQRAQVARAKRA